MPPSFSPWFDLSIRVPHLQEMTEGKMKLVGSGTIRDVYVVKYRREKLVVKVTRDDFGLRAPQRVENMCRREVAALTAVRNRALTAVDL